jgi:hypothetical protein
MFIHNLYIAKRHLIAHNPFILAVSWAGRAGDEAGAVGARDVG